MKLNKSEWDQLLKFQGYGNLKGPVWFLGIEEKLPDKGKYRNRELGRRLQFDASMDLAHAQKLLDRDIGDAKTKTWNWMSKFALALLHPAYDWEDRKTTQFYKRNHLGRSNGETFLTELFPLPAKNKRQNPYPEKYRTREDYERQVTPARLRWLSDSIKRNKPRYVIIYGAQKKYAPLFTELGTQLVKKTQYATLDLYKCKTSKTTTQILRFSFFKDISHKRVAKALRLFKDDRTSVDRFLDDSKAKELISDVLLNQVKAGVDIAKIIKRYVRLTPNGKNLTGICPFCETEPPSLMVSRSDQSFICFRCFVGGNVFAFLHQITSAPFSKIVRFLGHEIGLDVPVCWAGARRQRLDLKHASKQLCLPLRK